MASFTVECKCGERYHVDDAQIGRLLQCRRCRRQVAIKAPNRASPKQPKAESKRDQARDSRQYSATNATHQDYIATVPRTLRWRIAAVLGWGYLAASLFVAALLWGMGDRNVIGSVLLFMGRWVFLLPLALLVPVVAWLRARQLIPLAVGALVAIGPVMGFRTGWRRILPSPAGQQVRVVSFNAGGGRVAAQILPSLLDRWQAQIVAFQECGEELAGAAQLIRGWHLHTSRDLCFLSRFPIESASVMDRSALDRIKQSEPDEPGGAGYVVRYLLTTPRGPIRAANLHLETPRKGFEGLMSGNQRRMQNNTEIREIEANLARSWVSAGTGPLVVLGDFNTPVESVFFRENWGHLDDAFSVAGSGFGITKHNGWIGVRIDHVLTNEAWHVDQATVDDGQRISDHSPLIVDLTLPAAGR